MFCWFMSIIDHFYVVAIDEVENHIWVDVVKVCSDGLHSIDEEWMKIDDAISKNFHHQQLHLKSN